MARVALLPSLLLLVLCSLFPLSSAVTGVTISTNFSGPNGIIYDGQGYLYVTDSYANSITKMTTAGVVASRFTFSPTLSFPIGLGLDSLGFLYVADANNARIVKFNSAGTSVQSFTTTNPTLSNPLAVAFDKSNNLYIADALNNRIVVLFPNGTQSSVLTTAGYTLSYPAGVAFDPSGNLYIADWNNGRVLKRTSAGVTTVVLTGLSEPQGLISDAYGNIFFTDDGDNRVVEISSSGAVIQILNTTNPSFVDPADVALDGLGNVYVTDFGNARVWKFAGAALPNPATVTTISTSFTTPRGVVYNPVDGNLYVCDASTEIITKMTTAGTVISTFTFTPSLVYAAAIAVDSAGFLYVSDGSTGDRIVKFSRNGTQVATFTAGGTLNDPLGLFVDPSNNIWVTDFLNNRVVQLSSTGATLLSITTSPSLSGPTAVVVDSAGNAYISDFNNQRVVKRTSAGVVSTLYSGLLGVEGLVLDGSGNLFIADDEADSIVEITTSGVLVNTFTAPTSAALNTPIGVTLDAAGNLYVADYGDGRIVRFTGVTGSGSGTTVCTSANALVQLNPVSILNVTEGVTTEGENNALIIWGTFTTPASIGTVTASQTYFQFLFAAQTQNFTIEFGLYTVGTNPTLIYEGVYSYTLPSPSGPELITVTAYSTNASLSLQPSTAYYLAYWSPANFNTYDAPSTATEFFYQTAFGLQSSLPGAVFGNIQVTLPLEFLVCPAGTVPPGVPVVSTCTSANALVQLNPVSILNVTEGVTTEGENNALIIWGTFTTPSTLGAVSASQTYFQFLFAAQTQNFTIEFGLYTVGTNPTLIYEGVYSYTLPSPSGPELITVTAYSTSASLSLQPSTAYYLAYWSPANFNTYDAPSTATEFFYQTALGLQSSLPGAVFGNIQVTLPLEFLVCPLGTTPPSVVTSIRPPVSSSSTSAPRVSSSSSSAPASSPQRIVATLNVPRGLVADTAGNLYVSDVGTNLIYKISAVGTVTSFNFGLVFPAGMSIDSAGALYVADASGDRIVKFNSTGTLLASFYSAFNDPLDVSIDSSNNMWVADYSNNRVVQLSPSGTVLFTVNSTIISPAISGPDAVAVDLSGNVFISDSNNNRIVKRTAGGVVSVFYTLLSGPEAVGVDYLGNVYMADFFNNRFIQVSPTGVLLATFINVTNPFAGPVGVAVDNLGNLYGCDYSDGRVVKFLTVFPPQPALPSSTAAPRALSSSSSSSPVANTGDVALPGTYVRPYGVVYDGKGNLFVSDQAASIIYKMTTAGVRLYSIALPTGTSVSPKGLALDSFGYLYVCDQSDNRVIKLAPNNGSVLAIISTSLNAPDNIAIDASNNIYVTDEDSASVVVLSPGGVQIATYTTLLSSPTGIALSPSGVLYVADIDNSQIVKFVGGVASVFYGLSSGPQGLVLDSFGNLYVSESNSARVVQISPSGVLLQVFTGGLSYPCGVTLDGAGDLYVADYFVGEVFRFSNAFTPVPVAASLCYLAYGLSGNIDFPWSVATLINLQYIPTIQGTAVAIVSGTGTRTYTNRFGTSSTTTVTVTTATDDLLYLTNGFPFDNSGLTLRFGSPIQLPGAGPSTLFSSVTLRNTSIGIIVEGNSSRIDGASEAFLSNVAGFTNITIGAANVNSLAAVYGACQAPITFTNGLRQPTQPTVSNGGTHIRYSYVVSDGVTYSVQTNLTITAISAFATTTDGLGNPYQTISNITGTRTYTYLPTSATVVSQVRGPVAGTSARFYPYALLSAAPGLYSINSAPFLDGDGLTFSISPSAPIDGNAPGTGTQISQVTVHVSTFAYSMTLLNEVPANSIPASGLQQQSYLFS